MAKKLINLTANETVGTTIYQPHRFRDEKGLWQVEIPSGIVAGCKVRLFGRAAPEAPWHQIVEEDVADMGATTQTNVTNVDLFPEVSIEVASYGGSGTIRGWLVD